MARVELGVSRMRARRRKRRILAGLVVFFLLVIFASVVVWLSRASFLRISSLTISGTQTIATSTIESKVQGELDGHYWYLFAKNNIFLYPKGAVVSKLLASIPTLQSVDVNAENFNTIKITVVERHPKALWCGEVAASSTNCFFLDEGGLAYAPTTISGTAYKRYFGALVGSSTPRQYLGAGQFRSLSALIDAIAQTTKNDFLESAYVDENGDVHVEFRSRFELMFTLSADGGDVYQRLELALTSEPFKSHKLSDFLYLDLRFGDKLYYKLR